MIPTSASTPPTRSSISWPSTGWRLTIVDSASVSLPGLVDDLVGHADLADVVQQRGELEVAAVARVEAEGSPTAQRERDDAVAVLAAGVGVVGLEQVAHQQRGAAIGVRQRERLVDARAPLAREEGEQPHDGKHDGHGERLALAGHAARMPIGRGRRRR
jgi:hypothetical protein